jgi:class 3 adenylate cyclase
MNFGSVNSNAPIIYNPVVLVTVLKAARIARLIPSSAVVDISTKMNFYWYLQRCNPLWHWKRFKERRHEMNQQVGEGLDLSSAVKLKARGVGIKYGRTKKTLHYFGLVPDPNRELKRHLAAMKIQRAWRWKNWVTRLSTQRPGNDGATPSSNGGPKYRNFSSSDIQAQTQVGRAMSEITGQRLAITILASLLLTLLFTYMERNATFPSTMVVLHGQTTGNATASSSTLENALGAARRSSIPGLFEYHPTGLDGPFEFGVGQVIGDLREREKLQITVEDQNGNVTKGLFVYREQRFAEARVRLMSTIFTCLIWFLGVTAFAGPIMTLVIKPIERMVRLLGMLTLDPLGYQTNSRFKKFMFEEDAIADKSQWTKEVLKGMETAFLMSTILQIGNLMKVGFGSAGVEIIRNNLQKGQNTNMLILNERGSTVSCIFLFCDIRQFTDATECLQEEVFVFTNRIAAVVHSICHSYGGSANKNIGDAFLVTWQLEDDNSQTLTAKHHQADKALLSVVKICMALQYDDYYIKTMSENARAALLNKLSKRPGPVVQMGFGLHAGKAVQGAIGSQRKIDATYVSEAVEKAEFLESSTKQYGLKMLMSDCFHELLDPKIRRRCRKLDQVYFPNDEDEAYEPSIDEKLEMRMELFTFDMDLGALWKNKRDMMAMGGSFNKRRNRGSSRRMSMSSKSSMRSVGNTSDEMRASAARTPNPEESTAFEMENEEAGHGELVLPTGIQHYKDKVWLKEDIRLIREKYTTAVIQDFNSGLQKYYDQDWVSARRYFEMVLERFDDGPSNYFLEEMKRHDGKPPKNFSPIRRVD